MFKPSMSIPSCYKNVKMLIFYRGVILEDWGHVDLKLDEFMKKNNISRSSLSRNAQIHYNQLLKYCKNDMQKVDLNILARICKTINCEIGEIIEYIPPDDN